MSSGLEKLFLKKRQPDVLSIHFDLSPDGLRLPLTALLEVPYQTQSWHSRARNPDRRFSQDGSLLGDLL